MLASARKFAEVALPQVSWRTVLSATTITSFVVLLAQDQIHPVVVYLLQLYLAF